MGCILEFIFQILFEGLLELIVYCYKELVKLIVPNKVFTDKTKKRLENIILTISAILVITLVIGLVFLIQSDPLIKNIGRYMTYIPLTMLAIQIALGIVMKIINKF